MGFPQRAAEGVVSICVCHKEAKVGGGYTCPRCKARVCELPTECGICGLTLVSSPHLARSYHHLFPITPFDEVPSSPLNNPQHRLPRFCFGCWQSLLHPGNKSSFRAACPKCNQHFCIDCDIYIHESLHNCPGCESLRCSKTPRFESHGTTFAALEVLNMQDLKREMVSHMGSWALACTEFASVLNFKILADSEAVIEILLLEKIVWGQ
ncbi:hypothetical protein NE237_020772 [Protea cynaroides]|uniref:General transcription factor IIH subunit 2 n=1 Tax=Protea cynaroides TaxID=273540 RepID=A0A9Q0H6R2_9MAGN|nr:hypothetical protein NE237_020772 [Protea cynaroides]